MIAVAVSGAAGRMGTMVAQTVGDADDLELVACYDPEHPGAVVAGLEVTDDPQGAASADVVVEFTRPDVVIDNLRTWRSMGLSAAVGTSGFDAERIDTVRDLWGSGPPNVIIVPNFSIGAVTMMRLAELASPLFAKAEIIEMHHDKKVDAPSGTAIATAARMVGDPPIHSVRLPGLVAHQAVILGNPGETLTIRHDTTDRASFMPGVLLAVRRVGSLRDPVTVGLDVLLEG